MSSFDDYFSDEDDGRPHPADVMFPETENKRVTRSRADEIVDAVQGIRPDRVSNKCGSCGSTNVVIRGSGLGGNSTRKCRDCRLEVPWASVPSPVVQPSSRQILSGPFYGPPRAKPDKNAPPYRQALERKK